MPWGPASLLKLDLKPTFGCWTVHWDISHKKKQTVKKHGQCSLLWFLFHVKAMKTAHFWFCSAKATLRSNVQSSKSKSRDLCVYDKNTQSVLVAVVTQKRVSTSVWDLSDKWEYEKELDRVVLRACHSSFQQVSSSSRVQKLSVLFSLVTDTLNLVMWYVRHMSPPVRAG